MVEGRYWVEGNDGNRYRPADVATLKGWIAQGRLERGTMLVSESTGERVRADAVPGLFEAGVTGPPPVIPPTMGQAAPKKNSSTAVIVLAVLLGVCGFGTVVLAAILFPVFSQARMAAKRTQGLSNMKQLALGVILYSGDADDKFPPAMASAEAMRPYVSPYMPQASTTVFKTVNPNGGEILGDARLNGRSSVSLLAPQDAVVAYDSVAWPQDRNPVGFADGHASTVPRERISTLMKADPFGGVTKEQEEKDAAR